MSDDAKARARTATITTVLLLAFYVCSFGPVVWLYDYGYISKPTLQLLQKTVYRPLLWSAGRFKPLEELLTAYVYLLRE